MTQLFEKLFPAETRGETRRPQGKIAVISKVEIPGRPGFKVVRKDIMQKALAKRRVDEAA